MDAIIKILIMLFAMGVAGGFWWIINRFVDQEIAWWEALFEYEKNKEAENR